MANPKKSRHDTPPRRGLGVEELIARLRDQGVAQGRADADALLRDAQARAAAGHAGAGRGPGQPDRRSGRRQESDTLRTSGQEALELAFRDAMWRLRPS